jgi:hypothetical protein
MQANKIIWPDKSNFADAPNSIGRRDRRNIQVRLKGVREISSASPGISARVVEFDRTYLDTQYREPKTEKSVRLSVE